MALKPNEVSELNAAKAQVKSLWIRACICDGIEPDSKFVVFSPDNPVARDHAQAMSSYFALVGKIKRNQARRERHAAYKELGLNRVRGAQGGVYYE
jgi:hypothetical protein